MNTPDVSDASSGEGSQRLDEWLKLDQAHKDYHRNQWLNPYRSTLAFTRFCEQPVRTSRKVMDVGCGGGAATFQFAVEYPEVQFVGVDINAELIAMANAQLASHSLCNVAFETDDWFDLKPKQDVDMIVSIHTLMGLPDWRLAMRALFERVACRHIAISSLFYPGNITATVQIEEHSQGRTMAYNTYSVPEIEKYSGRFGYRLRNYQPFELDIDLPRPDTADRMGSYTVRCADAGNGTEGRRLQISGPLLMTWGFILLEKA